MILLRICLILALSGATSAPDVRAASRPPESDNVVTPGHSGGLSGMIRHGNHVHEAGSASWCGTDFDSPEARAILAQIKAERKAGLRRPLNKNRIPPDIGDRQSFNVSERSPNGDQTWIPMEFELVDTTALYHLWVEVAELSDGIIGQSQVNSLRTSILTGTPSRSIDPNRGFFANNNTIFGMPPDIDGDGIVDILIYDIGTPSVAGYVSGADQLVNQPDGQGNQRDILYLDSRFAASSPQTLNTVAAHEYAHLINFSYEYYITFLSEGMAEFASVMNGYYGRAITYISSVSEVSLPLFTWESPPNTADTKDYERGNLFVSYIGQQLGPAVVGEIMSDPGPKSVGGLNAVLSRHGSSLGDVLVDFHTANLLNDRSIDPAFGYAAPEYAGLRAFLTSSPIDGEIATSENENGFSLDFSASVNAGSVHYLRMTKVADVSFMYDTPDPTGLFYSEKILRNRARLVLEHADGSFSIREVTPRSTPVQVDGQYDTITFVLSHSNPFIVAGDRVTILAEWTPLSQVTDSEYLDEFPSVPTLASVWPNPFSGSARVMVDMDRSSQVRIHLYDLLGRHRATLHDGLLPAGRSELTLEAEDLESGTYIVLLQHDGASTSRTVTLVR
ncbi:MAG: hypothetical protein O2899_06565 [Bacteroidetes bacterium]|nr:hypothetical protein [Bacteroidota bacterium]